MQAQFIEGRSGPLFTLYFPPNPDLPAKGAVLYCHPFAEEMNKARRMVALQARRLAASGFAVLLPDMYGCGDSGGDFSDARWQLWLDDLQRSLTWLQQQTPAPLHFWGLRSGALLATELAREYTPTSLLLWQPVSNGGQFLTQFLRLRLAATMMSGQKETTKQLREMLKAGNNLEIAGYEMNPELADALDDARLQMPAPDTKVYWLELATEADRPLLPVSQRLIDSWQQEGIPIHAQSVVGDTFWATQEIAVAAELLTVSVNCLCNSNTE